MRWLAVIAILATDAFGDEALRPVVAEAFALDAAGMPALVARARFGMTRKEVAAAVPGFDLATGALAGRTFATFLFNEGDELDRVIVAVPKPDRDDWDHLVAQLGAIWRPADLVDRDMCVARWWWPAHHVRARVDSCAHDSVVFEPYIELASLDVARALAVSGKSVANAERTLRHRFSVRQADGRAAATLRIGAYELDDVILSADTTTGQLREVELRLPFVGSVARTRLEQLVRTARWNTGFASENGLHGYFWIRPRERH